MKIAILLAAYGSANPYSQRAIRGFEDICRQRFPDIPVRWAFTSLLLRERMANMRRKSDSVIKALERLWHEKHVHVAVQPLQAIPGQEYNQVCEAVAKVSGERGMHCAVGLPLLSSPADAPGVARALLAHLPPERKAAEDVVLMGHGAKHEACALYGDLAACLASLDGHVHLGTMSSLNCLEEIIPKLASDVVWLMPLLSVVGKHATNDMAGAGADSWRSRIDAAGHHCMPVLRGISEYAAVAGLWLDNLAQAVSILKNGCSAS